MSRAGHGLEAASAAVVDASRSYDFRIARIRADVGDGLRGSTWMVDGEKIEAADRGYWLDMQWLLDRLDLSPPNGCEE